MHHEAFLRFSRVQAVFNTRIEVPVALSGFGRHCLRPVNVSDAIRSGDVRPLAGQLDRMATLIQITCVA